MRQIRHVVIHCSATPNGQDVKLADIARMHTDPPPKGNGWSRIGYHYVIEIDGSLHEGCHVEKIGSHVKNHNADSIGICMVGTDRFTEAQWATLRDLVANLKQQHQCDVWGHRDYSPDKDGDGVVETHEWFKTCPGFDVAEWLMSGMDLAWNQRHMATLA